MKELNIDVLAKWKTRELRQIYRYSLYNLYGTYMQKVGQVPYLYSSIVYRHDYLSITTGSAVYLSEFPCLPFCGLIYVCRYNSFIYDQILLKRQICQETDATLRIILLIVFLTFSSPNQIKKHNYLRLLKKTYP